MGAAAIRPSKEVHKDDDVMVEAAKKLIKYQIMKFRKHSSILDQFGSERKDEDDKVPAAGAQRAASSLKQGYLYPQQLDTDKHTTATTQVTCHSRYGSIDQAVQHNQQLIDMCLTYGVTAEALLAHMHQVDPELIKRSCSSRCSTPLTAGTSASCMPWPIHSVWTRVLQCSVVLCRLMKPPYGC